MGQYEVEQYLKKQREENPDKWFTIKEIKEGLEGTASPTTLKNIHSHLFRLSQFGYIKVKGVGLWDHHKEFQGKK